MTCPACDNTLGRRINRRASLGAKIEYLKSRLVETEKLAKKTPPKTLVVECMRVAKAKELLPKLRAELQEALVEYETLRDAR